MSNNTVHYDFKRRRNGRNRKKMIMRLLAIFGSFLMVSGLIFSIVCYILGR